MKNYGEFKEMPFTELNGISKKTTDNHYGKLYQGYVKKWNEIQEKLETADTELANATYSDIRELKMEESFAANAVILHEAYFDVLGGNGEPAGDIIEAIENDFGPFDHWMREFAALAVSARGWVILAYDFNDGKLKNYIADSHNSFGIWGAAPILVLDMYEHAYFIDFGADKKAYIEAFFQNLNWEAVNGKFKKISGR